MTKTIFSFSLTLIFLAFMGCSNHPHPGIETGNPDVEEREVIAFYPGGGTDEAYTIAFGPGDTVTLTRIQMDGETVTAATVPYAQEGNTIQFEAEFPDGSQFDVTVTLDESGQVLSIDVRMNEREIPIVYGTPQTSDALPLPEPAVDTEPLVTPDEPSLTVDLISSALCHKLVSSDPEGIPLSHCFTTLGEKLHFRVRPGSTRLALREIAGALEEGTAILDEVALERCLEDLESLSPEETLKAWEEDEAGKRTALERLIPQGNFTCGGILEAPR